jgi:hypothetical protein
LKQEVRSGIKFHNAWNGKNPTPPAGVAGTSAADDVPQYHNDDATFFVTQIHITP